MMYTKYMIRVENKSGATQIYPYGVNHLSPFKPLMETFKQDTIIPRATVANHYKNEWNVYGIAVNNSQYWL